MAKLRAMRKPESRPASSKIVQERAKNKKIHQTNDGKFSFTTEFTKAEL